MGFRSYCFQDGSAVQKNKKRKNTKSTLKQYSTTNIIWSNIKCGAIFFWTTCTCDTFISGRPLGKIPGSLLARSMASDQTKFSNAFFSKCIF